MNFVQIGFLLALATIKAPMTCVLLGFKLNTHIDWSFQHAYDEMRCDLAGVVDRVVQRSGMLQGLDCIFGIELESTSLDQLA